MVGERLVHFSDRHIVAILYLLLGVLNAPSWPYLVGFIAVGAIIDASAPKFLSYAAARRQNSDDDPLLAHKVGRRRLRYLAAAFLVLGYGIVVVAKLSTSSAALMDALGPAVFAIASPITSLLRSHYLDLLSDGYVARANLAAVVEGGLFILFYATMAMVFSINRCSFPGGTVLRAKEGADARKTKIWPFAVLLPIFFVVIAFAVYVVTYAQIDYSDQSLGRRHLNLNLRDHDRFFYDLVFLLGMLCLLLPFTHQLVRYLLLKRHSLRHSLGDTDE